MTVTLAMDDFCFCFTLFVSYLLCVQGVILVLLQHQFLSSLDQEQKKPREKNQMLSEKFKPALFSLVSINPLSGKSLLASQLCPPIGWTGRLDEDRWRKRLVYVCLVHIQVMRNSSSFTLKAL